jgi:hypothetical protein
VRLPTLAGTSSRGLRSLPERGFFCVIRNDPVRTLRRHGGFAVQISGQCWRRGRETRSVPCFAVPRGRDTNMAQTLGYQPRPRISWPAGYCMTAHSADPEVLIQDQT